jgi:antitoxin component of MazEF toxin-antitoxin module
MRGIQRVLKHGSSAVVTIPRPFLYHLGWIIGQGVMVELLEDKQGLILRAPRLEDFGPMGPPRVVQANLLESK